MGIESLILLDTHVLIWLDQGNPRLGRRARRMADAALGGQRLVVSAISFWETALLAQMGRIELSQSLDRWRAELLDRGLQEIAVSGEIAIGAAALPEFHPDPADRIIVATATLLGSVLISADQRILRWPGALRRQDAGR